MGTKKGSNVTLGSPQFRHATMVQAHFVAVARALSAAESVKTSQKKEISAEYGVGYVVRVTYISALLDRTGKCFS
jgi:hypothetical protein